MKKVTGRLYLIGLIATAFAPRVSASIQEPAAVMVSPTPGAPIGGASVVFGAWQDNDHTYAAGSKATMTLPSSSQLTGTSITFTWSAGVGATVYWLDVGTIQGRGNLFGQNVGLATSRVVAGIPLNGVPIYVRLWTQLDGVWQVNDYIYTAPSEATLATPLIGPFFFAAGLCHGTQTFTWNAGGGASAYWLDVGSAPGSGNVFGQNVGLTTSRTVTGIPPTGIQYVRLWTQFSSGWVFNDYSFLFRTCGRAQLSFPQTGPYLTGPSVNFTFSGVGASAYWLDVGTERGEGNIFGQYVGLATEQRVAGIPTINGAFVYVRLWSLLGDTWEANDYTFTASGSSTKAVLVSPLNGAALLWPAVTFKWNAGAGATEDRLDVGTAPGQGDVFGRNVGLATSQKVTGIPAGGPVFARLWSKLNGVWEFNDYSFTAVVGSAGPSLQTPMYGSILSGPAVTFSWNAAWNALEYWLYVGTAPGGNDLFNSSMGTSTSVFVSGLPTGGTFTYAKLWTRKGSSWSSADYVFFSGSPISKAVLTSPTAGVMLTSSTATFSWNAGAGASAYWLDVGSAPGSGNYFGADVGLVTTRTVTGLPTDGSPVYVRLWTKLNDAWQYNDYSFTALH